MTETARRRDTAAAGPVARPRRGRCARRASSSRVVAASCSWAVRLPARRGRQPARSSSASPSSSASAACSSCSGRWTSVVDWLPERVRRGRPALRVRRAGARHPQPSSSIYPVINTILISFKDAHGAGVRRARQLPVRLHRREHAAVDPQHRAVDRARAARRGEHRARLRHPRRPAPPRRGGREVADLPADGDLVRRRRRHVAAHLQLPARGVRHEHRPAERHLAGPRATTRSRGCRSSRGTTCCSW